MDDSEVSYKFRIVRRGPTKFIVQEVTTSYCYGERLGAYGWCNAYKEDELRPYFKPAYFTYQGAKNAIMGYREGVLPSKKDDEVLWEEGEEDD